MLVHRGGDRARGGHTAIGVVGQRNRGSEHAEHPVAEELVRVAAVGLEDRDDDPEELVQQRDGLACRRRVGEAREAARCR